MSKLSLMFLLLFASFSECFAQPVGAPPPPPQKQSPFASAYLATLYVDEVFENGDEGTGISFGISSIVTEEYNFFTSVGLEIAYVESDSKRGTRLESGTQLLGTNPSTELTFFLFNYTLGGTFDNSNFVWEAGTGFGFMNIDLEVDNTSGSTADDSDVVGVLQIFGRLGYEFDDGLALLVGLRHIDTGEADLFGAEGSILDSVALDLSLKLTF